MSSNEIFPLVPAGWRSTTLGELAKESGGSIQTGPFGSQLHAADYVDEGIPSIMPKNIRIDGVDTSDIARVSPKDVERLAKHKVLAGDVVYSRRGDVEKCCLITSGEEGWLCGTGCLRVRIPSSVLSPVFLHAYLCHPAVREWIVRHAIGATMPNLNTSILSALPILVPPINEAESVADIWALVSRKISLNTQTNQTLEQMVQALFKSWFVDFDPVFDNALDSGFFEREFQGEGIPEPLAKRVAIRQALREAAGADTDASAIGRLPPETRALFPDRFEKHPELGWIPKGWEVKPVSEALDINPKVKLSKGTTAKFADMKAAPTSGYMIDGVIEKEFSGGSKFMADDVLLARITPCLENGKTAIVDFLAQDEAGFGSTEFIVMRGKGAVSMPFVACLSRLPEFRAHCIQSMVGSSGRQRVQNACFDSFYLTFPPTADVLEKFEQTCLPSFRQMTVARLESEALANLRDTLLPKLLSGELELANTEIIVEAFA
ncbi:restriction endonuclease subunit S [Shewanella algae]|uniref:restriction endonuclease subunit S n=1 Tax=Shewanella algae TaxID=38313 RepID=UPI003004FD3F